MNWGPFLPSKTDVFTILPLSPERFDASSRATSQTIEDSLGYKTSGIETIHILCVGLTYTEYRSKCEKTNWPKKRYFGPFHIESMPSQTDFFIKQRSSKNTSFDIKKLGKIYGGRKVSWDHTCD
jgi:hypothetical protein